MPDGPRNIVGIDISKGKSTIAVMRPFGEIVKSPFEVKHTSSDLKMLADIIKSLDGETRVVMEYTGTYYQPVARYLSDSGLYVSVVHAKLIHDFANNSIRRTKTDKADAVKIANYGLSNWEFLTPFSKEDETRLVLKTQNRQYGHFTRQYVASRNALIAIVDQTCPGLNELFTNPRKADGRLKWVDVYKRFGTVITSQVSLVTSLPRYITIGARKMGTEAVFKRPMKSTTWPKNPFLHSLRMMLPNRSCCRQPLNYNRFLML